MWKQGWMFSKVSGSSHAMQLIILSSSLTLSATAKSHIGPLPTIIPGTHGQAPDLQGTRYTDVNFLRLNVPSVYVSPVLCSCLGQHLTTHTSNHIKLHSFRKSFHFSYIQGIFCPSRGREICPVKPTFELSHPPEYTQSWFSSRLTGHVPLLAPPPLTSKSWTLVDWVQGPLPSVSVFSAWVSLYISSSCTDRDERLPQNYL